MGERHYMISVLDENGSSIKTVNFPESELKQRLRLVSFELSREFGVDHDEAIDILLHGEGEKSQYDLPGCEEEAGPGWKGDVEKVEEREWTPKQLAKHLKEHPEQKIVLDQPSPTPSREDWRKWIDAMPCDMITGDWFLKMRQWFRSMPCVPKE